MTTAADPWAEPDEETRTDTPEALEKAADDKAGADAPPEEPKAAEAAEKPAEEATPTPEPTPEPAKKTTAKKTAAKKTAAAPAAEAPKPAPPKKKATGLGSTLSEQTTYVTELVWGPEGTGKTTDLLRMTKLCKDNQRVLVIDAEAGAKIQALRQRGVDVSKVEVWPKPEDGGPSAITFESMYDLADDLRYNAELYVGWIWDSGTEITKRLLDQVTAEARVKDARIGKDRGRFQINLEDHGVASAMLRELLRKFRDLPMHGGITALERRDIDNDTGKVKYGPAMPPAMANDACGLVDLVIFKEINTIAGEEIRTGHSVPTKTRRSKDRFGVLPGKLADPYFDRIVAYVNGEITKESDPVQARVRELAQAAANPGTTGAATTNTNKEN